MRLSCETLVHWERAHVFLDVKIEGMANNRPTAL